jgi:hypothetical protein
MTSFTISARSDAANQQLNQPSHCDNCGAFVADAIFPEHSAVARSELQKTTDK